MEREIYTWLEDIWLAIAEIESFLPGAESFLQFRNDLKGKRAIERNLEIIGEAVNRILKVRQDLQITHARKIIDTRNRIAHGYDTVSDEVIWTIVTTDLKFLKEEINLLINN